ncbi:hypothetical protein KM043_012853 [Ampulex compressa]|nr:hypothetical protein KM043_012853 [Ampulex compressa]
MGYMHQPAFFPAPLFPQSLHPFRIPPILETRSESHLRFVSCSRFDGNKYKRRFPRESRQCPDSRPGDSSFALELREFSPGDAHPDPRDGILMLWHFYKVIVYNAEIWDQYLGELLDGKTHHDLQDGIMMLWSFYELIVYTVEI